MKRLIPRQILFGLLASTSVPFSMSAWADPTAEQCKWVPPGDTFVYAIILLILIGAFAGLIWISVGLSNSKWSFADATSEEVVGFLAAGMVLFTPYTVNKFAAIFENFKPKKTN